MEPLPRKISIAVFSGLTALLYAILAAAAILGFLRLYTMWLVVPLTLALAAAILWLYRRNGVLSFYNAILGDPAESVAESRGARVLSIAFYAAGLAIAVLLILLPVVRWPYSPISETLHWDAGLYHFPKALEMLKTGSAWDLSISYGEYPFGYESLYALAAGLTRSGALFGLAHGLTCLYLLLTFWFLLRRYTGLPGGATFFVSSFMLMSGFFSQIDSNLWWIFKSLVYTIGKNDLFLGAALLAVLLHAPAGAPPNRKAYSFTGLAVTSMIAASIKPNALPVLLAVWAGMGAYLWWQHRHELSFKTLPWKETGLYAALMLPGGLWALRNLIAEHAIISSGAMQLQQGSIINNLTNPFFYQNIPQDLARVFLILAISAVLAIFLKHVGWGMVGAYALLLAGFAFTPASAYFGSTQTRPEIAWRFAVAALAVGFILPVAWFSPWIRAVYNWLGKRLALSGLVAVMALGFTGWFVYRYRDVLSYRPGNAIVLQDQFRQPVGVDGYHSAYDYIQRNVRDSIVWVENGLPFYVYGPGFTNSVTRAKQADYLVIFQTAWNGGTPHYPEYVNDPSWQAHWKIVYEDSQGRVYKRVQ